MTDGVGVPVDDAVTDGVGVWLAVTEAVGDSLGVVDGVGVPVDEAVTEAVGV